MKSRFYSTDKRFWNITFSSGIKLKEIVTKVQKEPKNYLRVSAHA